jgi:putative Holliday junction resolvase
MRSAYLGVDYGRKRIGLALSEAGLIARPLKTIENKGEKKTLIAFAEIIKGHNIATIVVGLPVHKKMAMADEVKAFGHLLAWQLQVRVVFQNEMLTSVEAKSITRDKNLIDSVAAAVILQDYLKAKGEK